MLAKGFVLCCGRHSALQAEVEELLSAKEDAEAHAAELHGKVLEREMRARRAEDERDQERGGREALAAQLRQADKAVLELQVGCAWEAAVHHHSPVS